MVAHARTARAQITAHDPAAANRMALPLRPRSWSSEIRTLSTGSPTSNRQRHGV